MKNNLLEHIILYRIQMVHIRQQIVKHIKQPMEEQQEYQAPQQIHICK